MALSARLLYLMQLYTVVIVQVYAYVGQQSVYNYAVIIQLLAAQAMSQELNSTLHSALYGVQVAFVDENVVFTCVVRSSNSMAWTSEEYIGTGGQRLELSAAEPLGTRYSAVGNNQTVAELVGAVIDVIIVSQLRIRVKSTYPTASVQCNGINGNAEITFLLAGMW